MNDCNDSQLEMLWSPYSLCFVMPYINRRLSLFPPSFPTRVLLAHPAPATMASFLFLIAKHLLILGPSYLLFPLSGLFFLQISARFAPSLHFNSSQRVFSDLFYLFIYNYFFIGGMILYWSIVDLTMFTKYSFRCTAKWFSYTYTYIYSFSDSFPI